MRCGVPLPFRLEGNPENASSQLKEEVMKASFIRALRLLWPVAVLPVLSTPLFAGNTTLNYNPAAITWVASPCGSFVAQCATSAYFDATSLDAQNGNDVSALFQDAFNAWNPGGWTLNQTPAPGGGTFDITGDPEGSPNSGLPAAAGQFSGVKLGGLTILINLDNVALPTLSAGQQLVWMQGLQINYTPGPNAPTVAPYYTMDTSTLSGLDCTQPNIFCPPAYPYQYNDNSFYDQPKAFYQAPGQTQAFFNADAYLAVEDTTNDTVDLLDGVAYGFQNYVIAPEPGTLMLFGTGLLGLAGLVRRKLSRSA
jgi:hypothetical protein